MSFTTCLCKFAMPYVRTQNMLKSQDAVAVFAQKMGQVVEETEAKMRDPF